MMVIKRSRPPNFLIQLQNRETRPAFTFINQSADGCFPDEVVLHILSRLPIKSLFRTKCVSKNWYKLTSDKYFIQLYNHLSLRNPLVLIELAHSLESRSSLISVDDLRGVSEFSLDFIKDRVKVRASCNGLLCCASIPDKGIYYVCNPITREYKLLPRTRERPVSRFYPDGEATLVGLASDLTAQKFKVVLAGYHRTFGHRPDNRFICFIFDSESNKWKKFISQQDENFTHMNRNQVVFVKNSLHWMTETCTRILALDLNLDAWRKIRLPDDVSGSGQRVYLLEMDELLSVIQISEGWMSIWVVKDYENEEWEMVDRVSLRCIRGMVPGIFPISQTAECVFLATHKQVLVYKRKSRTFKEMYSVENSSTLPLWFSAHSFRTAISSCR